MFKYYILTFLIVLLYLKGFFPSSKQTFTNNVSKNVGNVHKIDVNRINIEKTVIIVIDALRIDFIQPNLMPYLTKAMTEKGCFDQLITEMPTVTLPRIKAFIAGYVPEFIDVILNLAHTDILPDSLIHRAIANNKKVVFYGDNTWLKLFPSQFTRYEGTTSFYVNDFIEVDNNVTRNIDIEIKNNDWDIMILHYLGLDHIGHVYGPKSTLMPDKLAEMDLIFNKIHTAIKSKTDNSLIIITSDHGMKDTGGHGGSTYAETHIPFVVVGFPCINDSFPQIDVAANLATLLNLEIPQTSIGVLRRSLLNNFSFKEFLDAIQHNVNHLRNKIDLCERYNEAMAYHNLYEISHSLEDAKIAIEYYENCSNIISDTLRKSSTNQNFNALIIAMCLGLIILLRMIISRYDKRNFDNVEEIMIFFIAISELFEYINTFQIIIITIILTIKNIIHFVFILYQFQFFKMSVLIFGLVVHPITFFASSFIEEEHVFWYFLFSNYALYLFIKKLNKSNNGMKSIIVILFAARFIMTINFPSGQDLILSRWLLKSQHLLYLQILFIFSLFLIMQNYIQSAKPINKFSLIFNGIILALIFIFRWILHDNILLGQLLWCSLFIKGIENIVFTRNLITFWILLITLLLKPYNTVLVPFALFTSNYFHKNIFNNLDLILAHLCLGKFLFFAQGHSNSLASVDVATGYIGLSSYEPVWVFSQVWCHTFAIPVLCILLLLRNSKFNNSIIPTILLCNQLYIILIVFSVAFLHRHHLFIWSVFAPKVIVEASHFASLFIVVFIYYLFTIFKNFKIQIMT